MNRLAQFLMIAILSFFVFGCSWRQKPDVIVEEVEVPVIVYQPLPRNADLPPRSELPIWSITQDTQYEEVVKLYIETIARLQIEIEQLREALKPYARVCDRNGQNCVRPEEE